MSDVASNEKHESAVPVTPPATVLETAVTATAEVVAETTLLKPPSTATEAELATPTKTLEQVGIDVEAAGDAANDSKVSKPTEVATPKKDNKKTPAKRTPSKRMSFIERAQKESEELVKNMGGSLELEGGRRTRSSTRGTPTRVAATTTPPPAKKARNSPANATNTTPSRARGRGRKIDTAIETAEDEVKKPEEETETEKTVDKEDVLDKDLETPASDEIVQNATKEKNESSAIEDDVDAALDPVPEEKQNNIDHASEEKVEKSDTPMETDEQTEPEPAPTTAAHISVEKADKEVTAKVSDLPVPVDQTPAETAEPAEATVAPVTSTVQKEPTPEPMEVDSSTKDDVAVTESASNSVAEKADTNDSATTASANAQSEPETANKSLSDDAEQPSEDAPTLPVTENSNAVAEKTNAVENDTKCDAVETENDHKATANVEAKSENNSVVAETKDVTNANETVSKPENDFCEPKIVSPSINTNSESTTTTPQYCN